MSPEFSVAVFFCLIGLIGLQGIVSYFLVHRLRKRFPSVWERFDKPNFATYSPSSNARFLKKFIFGSEYTELSDGAIAGMVLTTRALTVLILILFVVSIITVFAFA